MDTGSALLAFRRNLFGYRMGRISAPVVNLSSMSAKQARNTAAVLREIARAKARFGVPESAGVFSCYEAGRDGFWLYRCYRVDPQEREAIPHGRRNVIRIMLAGLNSVSGVRFIVGWSVAVSAAG
jgi:hypothetical protein